MTASDLQESNAREFLVCLSLFPHTRADFFRVSRNTTPATSDVSRPYARTSNADLNFQVSMVSVGKPKNLRKVVVASRVRSFFSVWEYFVPANRADSRPLAAISPRIVLGNHSRSPSKYRSLKLPTQIGRTNYNSTLTLILIQAPLSRPGV